MDEGEHLALAALDALRLGHVDEDWVDAWEKWVGGWVGEKKGV